MKVLVVGKGGREHALVWKIAQSPRLEALYAAPGSAGIAPLATCLPDIRVDTSIEQEELLKSEILRLRDFALAEAIDLTVVGPEDALAGGIVDCFEAAGLKVFGPTAAAARIESDKAFAKELMTSIGVPTARYRSFTDAAAARQYIGTEGAPIVVKATGLAAGKGAVVALAIDDAITAVDEMMDARVFGAAGSEVVIEEFMEGEEASLFAICDGSSFVCLVPAQDHKRIGEGDSGPNTGGMGAYAPAPVMTAELVAVSKEQIIAPVLEEMVRRGIPYRGVLYVNLMITDTGPRVVEFNARFGDPEAQVVLPLMQEDLLDVIEAAVTGNLYTLPLAESSERAAVCVVLASAGYPGSYETGLEISGLDRIAQLEGITAFHAGTRDDGGRLVTNGGRVLGITAVGDGISAAVDKVYETVSAVSFEGMYCRRDIAHRALARLDGSLTS